jgi:hypothetical protein
MTIPQPPFSLAHHPPFVCRLLPSFPALPRHIDDVDTYGADGKEKRALLDKEMEDLDASGSYQEAGKSE